MLGIDSKIGEIMGILRKLVSATERIAKVLEDINIRLKYNGLPVGEDDGDV